ncbi:hypothetical protein TB1_033455 [Malus domestica]
MASDSLLSRSTFFSGAVTSVLNLLLWRHHLCAPPSSPTLHLLLRCRADLFSHDETDGDDELKAEFLCPFCAEDFDVVGLCCHIDEEHPVEAKNRAFCSISPFLV